MFIVSLLSHSQIHNMRASMKEISSFICTNNKKQVFDINCQYTHIFLKFHFKTLIKVCRYQWLYQKIDKILLDKHKIENNFLRKQQKILGYVSTSLLDFCTYLGSPEILLTRINQFHLNNQIKLCTSANIFTNRQKQKTKFTFFQK